MLYRMSDPLTSETSYFKRCIPWLNAARVEKASTLNVRYIILMLGSGQFRMYDDSEETLFCKANCLKNQGQARRAIDILIFFPS